MMLSIKTEVNVSLKKRAVKIYLKYEKLISSVFGKDKFSEVCTNFISFIPLEYKLRLINNY